MIRSKDIQTAKKEIASFRRKVKTTQADIIRTWEITRSAPITENEYLTLEQKEKRFRLLKRKLADMEQHIQAMQEGQEPERVKVRTVSRPGNESFILAFVGA